jgi:hypothetical protein
MKGAAADAMVESLDETWAVSRAAARAGLLATTVVAATAAARLEVEEMEVGEMDGRPAPVDESRREADSGVVAVVVLKEVVRESGTEEMAEEELLSLRCISGLSDILM